jgi:integral membrane protein
MSKKIETTKDTKDTKDDTKEGYICGMERSAVPLFRKIGTAEGISLLALLLIAMPLKYWANMPEAVKYTGWAHGLLFMAYCAVAIAVKEEKKWPFRMLIYVFIAAFLPLGTFIFDRKHLRNA